MPPSFTEHLSRRHFLAAAVSLALSQQARAAGRRPRIVLRSSWQTVNIGDIAHTPGVLALLEQHLPEAEVRLWPSKIDNGVEEILRARFPRVAIVQGEQDIRRTFDECDFFLHGSGPFLVAQRDVQRWSQATGKPYGVYGITFSEHNYATQPLSAEAVQQTVDVLTGARFVFFRDSPSLELARRKGCACPIMQFAPDGAFATDLTDDDRAAEFLARHDLSEGKFLCCIPRHRYTPYWTVPGRNTPFDPVKHAHSEQHLESDHAPLRDAIVEVVRQSDFKILLCPEDQTQMVLGKSILLDRLPDDVRKRVVWRPDYWLTGEARSTYLRSAGLFGHEMHSPIMCIGAGIPAIVCRWQEQTTKGFMWRDIGLADWLFDMDVPQDVERIVPTVLSLAQNPTSARDRARQAQAVVQQHQRESMRLLAAELAM